MNMRVAKIKLFELNYFAFNLNVLLLLLLLIIIIIKKILTCITTLNIAHLRN